MAILTETALESYCRRVFSTEMGKTEKLDRAGPNDRWAGIMDYRRQGGKLVTRGLFLIRTFMSLVRILARTDAAQDTVNIRFLTLVFGSLILAAANTRHCGGRMGP